MILMVDARTMGSEPSGIGMYLYNFLKEIIKDSSIHLILASDVADSFEIQDIIKSGAEVWLYGKRVFRSAGVFAYFRFVLKIAKKIKADIFWEPNNLIPLPMFGFKGKIALTVHDIFPISTPKNYELIYRIYFRTLLHFSIRQTHLIMYDSNFAKSETEQLMKNASKKKSALTYVIIPSVSHATNLDLKDNGYFFYVGNIEKRKGADVLLKAYQKYALCGGKRKLYLAGRIKSKDLKELLDNVNNTLTASGCELISYMGYTTNEEKVDKLSHCACFLFPSHAEGFGMPIVEAMVYYRPVIASDLDIFKELVGDTILYFERNSDEEAEVDNLVKAMREFDQKSNAGEIDDRAYNKVIDRYSPEKLGKNMIELFKNIV